MNGLRTGVQLSIQGGPSPLQFNKFVNYLEEGVQYANQIRRYEPGRIATGD